MERFATHSTEFLKDWLDNTCEFLAKLRAHPFADQDTLRRVQKLNRDLHNELVRRGAAQ